MNDGAKEPQTLWFEGSDEKKPLAAEIWNGKSLGQKRSPKRAEVEDRVVEGWSIEHRAAGM